MKNWWSFSKGGAFSQGLVATLLFFGFVVGSAWAETCDCPEGQACFASFSETPPSVRYSCQEVDTQGGENNCGQTNLMDEPLYCPSDMACGEHEVFEEVPCDITDDAVEIDGHTLQLQTTSKTKRYLDQPRHTTCPQYVGLIFTCDAPPLYPPSNSNCGGVTCPSGDKCQVVGSSWFICVPNKTGPTVN